MKYDRHYYFRFKQVGKLRLMLYSWLIDNKQPLFSVLHRQFVQGSKMLVYGCGAGLFLRSVSKHFACVGVDISTDAIALAEKNVPNAKVEVGSIEVLRKMKRLSFDVVTCFDVLEHVDVLDEYWGQFHRIIKDDGWFVVGVPTMGSMAFRVNGKYWSGFEDTTHVRLWSSQHWQQKLEEHGFVVWRRYSYGIVDSPTKGYQLSGWLRIAHYISQFLAITGIALPTLFSDGDYFVCIKNPYSNRTIS